MALENLLRYESAAIAGSRRDERPDVALFAMEDFYKGLGLEKDPLIREGFETAYKGLELTAQSGKPSITGNGLIKAISVYSNEFERAYVETPIRELTKYLGEFYTIPEDVLKELKPYEDKSVKDLLEIAKKKETKDDEKERIKKAFSALELLKNYRLESQSLRISKEAVNKSLRSIYPEKREK